MEDVQVFSNSEFGSVRTLTVNGEIVFIGKDITDILGYNNSRKAISDHVDEEDKGVTKCDTPGGVQNLTYINESGFYSLILSSRLPEAKRFKKWVTSEVLPSVRKHGLYAVDEILNDPDMLIKALTELKKEREEKKALQNEVAVQNQQILDMKPKAAYYDVILNCKDLVPVSVIAKDYGWSAIRLNKYLHDKKVQFKRGDMWFLYQKYADCGYTGTKTHARIDENTGDGHYSVHTYWTQKGRFFIYGLLKTDGILPVIERES